MQQATTYYDTLEITRFASDCVIRAAYRALCQKNHPDKHPEAIVLATKNLMQLNEAYAALSCPAKRTRYDDELNRRKIKPCSSVFAEI